MSPVETLLLDVDERHAGHCGGNSVHWYAECLNVECTWTSHGDVGGLRAALGAHRAHVAAEQAKALQAWLTSDEAEIALRLAEEGFRHSWDTSDERLIDGTWVAGLCCECGAFVPYGQEVAHVAAALAPLLADLIGGTP